MTTGALHHFMAGLPVGIQGLFDQLPHVSRFLAIQFPGPSRQALMGCGRQLYGQCVHSPKVIPQWQSSNTFSGRYRRGLSECT